MRMLLTSAGPANGALVDALAELLGMPFDAATVAVAVTASLAVPGDKRWLLRDLNRLDKLGFGEIDILDVASPDGLEDRLRRADVVYVEGGDLYHLVRVLADQDLVALFEDLVRSKVYLGASAGAMLFSRQLGQASAAVFGDENAEGTFPPFGYFPWYLRPHWHADYAPELDDAWAERVVAAVDYPVYLLDDDSAVRVRGERSDPVVDVVSEGQWRRS